MDGQRKIDSDGKQQPLCTAECEKKSMKSHIPSEKRDRRLHPILVFAASLCYVVEVDLGRYL